jgi:hypothetical protein
VYTEILNAGQPTHDFIMGELNLLLPLQLLDGLNGLGGDGSIRARVGHIFTHLVTNLGSNETGGIPRDQVSESNSLSESDYDK